MSSARLACETGVQQVRLEHCKLGWIAVFCEQIGLEPQSLYIHTYVVITFVSFTPPGNHSRGGDHPKNRQF